MSLQLSTNKPRQLQYAVGGLRSDLRLLEVDEKLLECIQTGDVMIKGGPQEDAVLCTANKTFALKLVETTNLLLLLPPQQEVDGDFAAIPSLPLPGDTSDASALRDVGLQTQLQKSAAAKDFPPLTATATVGSHLELVEVLPRLEALPSLLGKPYGLEDEETDQQQRQPQQQQTGGEADDPMDADDAAAAAGVGPSGTSSSGSRRAEGCHTTEELLQLVQASRAELITELHRLGAVQLGPFWRWVDPAYLGTLLEMLVVSAMERGWSLQEPIILQEALEALQSEGYRPALIKHCLEVYGKPSIYQQGSSDAQAAASQPTSSKAGSPSSSNSPSSTSSERYVLDEQRVCLHYARKLLQQQPVWPLSEFLVAWQAEVPGSCWCPQEAMLSGEALLLLPETTEGPSEPRVRHFPASQLPSAPGPRFAAIFAAQPRWTREQLDPYLADLKVPGQTVDMLLLKYARASQRSPSDSTLVFVAR